MSYKRLKCDGANIIIQDRIKYGSLYIFYKYVYNYAYRIYHVKLLQKDIYIESLSLNYVYVFKYFTVLFTIVKSMNDIACNNTIVTNISK